MKFSRICVYVVAGLVGGALLMTSTNAQDASATKAAPVAIGVCDIVKVFNDYERAKVLKTELDKRNQAILLENNKRVDALKALEGDLKGWKKGSTQYEKLADEIQKKIIEREAWLKFEQAIAMRNHRKLTREVYEEIRKVIQQVAQTRGIGLVLYLESSDIDEKDTAEMLRQIERNKVLYHDASIDLTEAVLMQMNQNYKKAGI